MDFEEQTTKILHTVKKVVGYSCRGIVTGREAVDKITGELAYYRRGDLTRAMLPLLTPELVSELRTWVGEVLQPGYRYQWRGLDGPPSEDELLQTQAELVALASRFARDPRLSVPPDLPEPKRSPE